MEKSWNLKKPEKSWKNHGILWNNLTEPPVARKLAVGHLCVRQLVFLLLVFQVFNYFKVHAWSTSMLLLLHSSFMLSVVKMLLKGEVGDRALNSHGNYIVDHGKIMELCFWISVGTLQEHSLKSQPTDWRSQSSNLWPLVYKASGVSTTPWRLWIGKACSDILYTFESPC